MQMKLLYLDDDRVQLKLFAEKLRRKYEVVTITNSSDGIDYILNQKPDVVVADLMIDSLNGIDVYDAVRFRRRYVPYIVTTATPDPHLQARALKKGLGLFVLKPIDYEILCERIDVALRFTYDEFLVRIGNAYVENPILIRKADSFENYYNSYLKTKPRELAIKLLNEMLRNRVA